MGEGYLFGVIGMASSFRRESTSGGKKAQDVVVKKFHDVDVTKISRVGLVPYFYLRGRLWFCFVVTSFSANISTIGGQIEDTDYNSLDALYRERDEETPGFPLDSPDIIGRNDCITDRNQAIVFQEVGADWAWYDDYDRSEILYLLWVSQSQLQEDPPFSGGHHWISLFSRGLRDMRLPLTRIRPTLGANLPPVNYNLPQVRSLPQTTGSYRDLLKDIDKVPWYHIFITGQGRYTYLSSGGRKYRLYNDQAQDAIDTILKHYPRRMIFTSEILYEFLDSKDMREERESMRKELESVSDPELVLDILYKYKELEYEKVQRDKSLISQKIISMYYDLGENNKSLISSDIESQT
jgi:hypothetical protein